MNPATTKIATWKLSILIVICFVLIYTHYCEDRRAVPKILELKNETCRETDLSYEDKHKIEVAIKNYKRREQANTSSLSKTVNAMKLGVMRGALTAVLFGNLNMVLPSAIMFGSMEGIFAHIRDRHLKGRFIDTGDLCGF
jgi:hypothetical protein